MIKECNNCIFETLSVTVPPCNVCLGQNKWILKGAEQLKDIKLGTTEEAKHYQVADIQPIEIMQMYLTPTEMIGGLKWQVIKYILRIGHKGSDREDAGKCSQYAQWLCDAMDGKKIVPGGKK